MTALEIKKPLVFKDRFLVRFFLFAAIIIYISFSFFHLSRFMTVDEQKWIFERIPKYWHSWMDLKPSGTLINDKPGISVALISGIGLLAEPHPEEIIQTVEKHVREYPVGTMERTLFYFRFPIVLFNGLAGWLIFWLLKKLTGNDWLSLWSVILILLSPPLVGISQIVNPDSLLWTFSILSMLAFANCMKTLEPKYAALSVLTLGLSIGSKYTAFILYPFFTLIYIAALIAAAKNNYAYQPLKAATIRLTALFSEIIFGSLLLFSLILPAIYFKTDSYLSQKTIAELFPLFKIILLSIISSIALVLADSFFLKNKILLFISRFGEKVETKFLKSLAAITLLIFVVALINWSISGDFLNLERIPFDAHTDLAFKNSNLFEKMVLEFRPLVFSLTPMVSLFFLFILCLFIIRKIALAAITGALIFFILLFHAAMIYNDLLTTIRYSIILYPLICILSTIGIWEFRNLFFTKIKLSWISFILILFSCASLASAAPYYFSYTSSLLPKKYLITGSWGEGGYEAAKFLNSLPDADRLTVWSDYGGVCEFFVGKCIRIYEINNNYKIDYYVLTRRGKTKYEPEKSKWKDPSNVDAYKYYERDNPIWSLLMNDRPENYIKIYQSDNFDLNARP